MPRLKEGASPPSGASLSDLERHKAAITRDLEKARTEDKGEVEALKKDLEEAKEWIAARKKADEHKDDQEGSTTIVVPPNTLVQQGGGETKPSGEAPTTESSKEGKRGWKRVW